MRRVVLGVLMALLPALLAAAAAAAVAAHPPPHPPTPYPPPPLAAGARPGPLLVVGSLNIDTTVAVGRLPRRGETVAALNASASLAVGGKGANQAAAAARLLAADAPAPRLVCRFGGRDAHHTAWARAELAAAGVDLALAANAAGADCGAGVVLLDAADGSATSVVLGGANQEGWPAGDAELRAAAGAAVAGAALLLLQREVPERVNTAYAAAAAAAGVPVLLDAGGADGAIGSALLATADVVAPNEAELALLTGLPTSTEEQARTAAAALLRLGARAVLATLGDRGALLLSGDGAALWQRALPVPGGAVVDATAAGDAFRAAFAVRLAEGAPLAECLRFAAAAGAVAASRLGAMPSLPSRADVEALLRTAPAAAAEADEPGGGAEQLQRACAADDEGQPARFPLRFASRLNSMRARRDLLRHPQPDDVLGWIARQGEVEGLDEVFFNYPDHTEGRSVDELRAALAAAGLAAGGVNTRFPAAAFSAGALSAPAAAARAAAVALAADGCRWARGLAAGGRGPPRLVLWSAFDGYDYHLQADYAAAWDNTVAALRAVCDACAGVEVSLEWKPTDPAARFSFVPSTGAALLLARDVARPNLGLALDTGHLLMAGENAAASAALAAREGRLAALHLNDGHARVGAEDGLAFGAVHGAAALELVYWLRRLHFRGPVYFDTFPANEDPVREAAHNVRRFKALWARAGALEAAGLGDALRRHDAMAALEALEALEAGGAVL